MHAGDPYAALAPPGRVVVFLEGVLVGGNPLAGKRLRVLFAEQAAAHGVLEKLAK